MDTPKNGINPITKALREFIAIFLRRLVASPSVFNCLIAVLLCYPLPSLALVNMGFEQPVVGSTGFQVFPTGAGVGWTFGPTGDGTGVSGKQSAFTNGNPLTGTGQVAFIQNLGTISQNVFLPAGQYVVTLSATQRMNYQIGTQTISISVGGVQRGTFTPTTGDLQNYSTVSFTIGTSGTYTLLLQGVGSGTDFTAFIDNVAISLVDQPLALVTNYGTPCNDSIAQFYTDFTPSAVVTRDSIWIRYMPAGTISVDPSGYGASVNTLLGPDNQTCSRGKTSTNTAQTTLQLLGKQGGFLMLSEDYYPKPNHVPAPGLNPHVFYGVDLDHTNDPNRPTPITYWQNPGDSLEVEAGMRMTMFNPGTYPSGTRPVGQFYIAFLATAQNGQLIQFSVLAYDSRNASASTRCDQMIGAGANVVLQGTFDPNASGCSSLPGGDSEGKFMWVPNDSATMQYGNSNGNNGAWSSLLTFKVRLTTEAMQRAITKAGQTSAPSSYTLHAVGILQESVWYGQDDNVDMASSFANLKVNRYRAQ
ncbi:MAG TPA: hypothetical protein VGL11_23115 [Candidatus Binatia bacterium]